MALCLVSSGILYSQDLIKTEVLDSVIIDTKINIPRKNSGKVVTVITSKILDHSPGKSVSQLLNEVSGIEINGNRSNDGQNLGYFVRGGRNRQVVIMMDGVQLNDPSQIANDYDLRLIPTSSIESIEIVKGASSVLYGSGAATAVINISTKKESKKPVAATFTSTYGSNNAAEDSGLLDKIEEITNYVDVNGTLKKFFYSASFSNRYVDGLSAVAAPEGEDAFDADVFNQYNGRINLGYKFKKDVKFSQFFSFDKFKADFDDFSYVDAEYQSISKQLRTGGHFEWTYKNGMYVFNDNYSWIEREINSSFPAKYDSKNYTLDTYITFNFSEKFTALAGFNYVSSKFNSSTIPFGETDFAQDVFEDIAKFEITDPYLNLVFTSGFGLNLATGARLNIHSDYGTHLVYNVNPSYVLGLGKSDLKFLASYSTAYITPSLFQLHDPLYGNIELKPEDNRTIEGGIEFSSQRDFRISAVYFNRNEQNYVDFVTVDPDLFIFQYLNIEEEFNASGVEVEVSKSIGNHLNISANYTNTQADERFALRIPEHKFNATIGYNFLKYNAGLNYQYNSEREDTFFNPETFESENITLESFGLLDANVSVQLSQNLKLFANVSNIINEEYEELYSFQTRGRNFRVGFTLSF